jgi:hypothetical protein
MASKKELLYMKLDFMPGAPVFCRDRKGGLHVPAKQSALYHYCYFTVALSLSEINHDNATQLSGLCDFAKLGRRQVARR